MKRNFRHEKKTLQFVMSLTLMGATLMVLLQAALISKGQTIYDGTTFDLLPSFYTLNGQNGMSVPLSNVNMNTKLDYFIRLWIRPQNNYQQNNSARTETLLFFNGSNLACQFTYNGTF